jgi:hypothetical protein
MIFLCSYSPMTSDSDVTAERKKNRPISVNPG